MAGRPVPWASWDEWDVVRRQLFGATLADVSAGAVRVQAWRSRGRLPLGVDITERLLSMQLHDPSACAARGPPFSSCLSPLTDAALQAAYALTLVRFVNGISDASQKGRVAASVSHHASSAGLHPVLVEVRHAATHSHLPSLHLLRHAASHALSWLHDNYWLGQAKVLAHNRASVSELLSRLWANHRACSTNVTCDASPAAHCASDTNSSASEHSPRSTISSAAALKREEKSLLGSLKGMAQESRAQDIASVLMEHAGHILDMKSPNQSSGHSQSQGSPLNADSDSRDHAHIHASVLRLLEAHYPRVAPHIMLEATKRLVAVLKTLLQHLSAGLKGPAGLDVHACNALIALHAAARQVVAASKAYNTADLDRLRMHNRRTMQTCFMRPAGVPAASYSRTLASFWESAVTPQQTQTRRCAAALITFLDSLRCNPQVCQFRMLNPLLCTQLSTDEAQDLLDTLKAAYHSCPREICSSQLVERKQTSESLLGHAQALKQLEEAAAKRQKITSDSPPSARFQRVASWRLCPIGTLPGPVEGVGVLPDVCQIVQMHTTSNGAYHSSVCASSLQDT